MNNLIVEPQCASGEVLRSVRAANLEFYSDHGISFVKQGRTANRNYSQPYVRCSPSRRSCDTHTNARRPSAEFYFCELFCHFLSSAIVSDGPHCVPERNELFHSVSFHSRRLSPSVSLFSPAALPVPTGVYIDLHSTVWPINISTRTFACKSHR